MKYAITIAALIWATSALAGELPSGLRRVMANGAGRVVNHTCADVRAAVAWYGEGRAVSAARSAGYSEGQIKEARKCLKR